MSFLKTSLLAQANAALDQATPGQVLSGMMVLLVMAASLAMIIVWLVRLRETGHALPAAQRGVLRVPLPLTVVAIALCLLMLMLMLLVSIEDQIIPPPVAAAAAASVADESSTGPVLQENHQDATEPAPDPPIDLEDSNAPAQETASADPADPAAKEGDPEAAPAAPKMTPEKMKSALVNTVVMDLILFFVFGFIVFLSNVSGRVRLPDSIAASPAAATADQEDSSFFPPSFPPNSFWPDLNDASSDPQQPGSPGLWQTTNPATSFPQSSGSGDSYYALSRDDGFSPFAQDRQEAAGEPEEAFSFRTELWYAGEVFLAAYVPTTFLRILVVLLTVGLLGEEPGQHPFLEMMNAGVDMTIMALILLTAVVFAPIVEEMQFRVVVLGGIAQVGRPLLALSVSSILFAFAHGFPDSLALLPLAFALGYAYLRRRSYITVMLVHFLFNAFNMALAFVALL